jgi:SHS2 domain-containing protein
MSFEELEHTADVLMRVRGADLAELFAEAGRAMFHVMYGPCDDRGVERRIEIEAENLESLLIDYLSELLFVTEVENTVFCTFDVDLRGTRLGTRRERSSKAYPTSGSKSLKKKRATWWRSSSISE